MIFGLFNGTTTTQIEKRIEKLNAAQQQVRTDIEGARADRIAAIGELKRELDTLASLASRV
jgi:outer membrane murein-binding lipoprotein Lpp